MAHVRLSRLLLIAMVCTGSVSVHAQTAVDPIEAARAAIRVKDFGRAMEILRVPAEAGDAEAQFRLGSLYRVGLGVRADAAAARQLVERAAERNHPAAAYALARMLTHDEPRDPSRADAWLKRAAEAGYPLALATAKRGSGPLQFSPQTDLTDPEARRAVLWWAIQRDQADLVEALADEATPRRRDEFGRSALALAAQGGASNVVSLLLRLKASTDQSDDFGFTPLMLGAAGRHQETVAALLQAGARLDATDRVGNSVLMHAAAAGQEPIVAALLAAGAPTLTRNAQGWSAIDWAVWAQAPRVVNLLEARGLKAKVSNAMLATTPAIPLARASGGIPDLYRGLTDMEVAAARSSPQLFNAVIGGRADGAKASGAALRAAAVSGSTATVEAVLAADRHSSPLVHQGIDSLSWVAVRGEAAVLARLLAHRSEGAPAALIYAVRARRVDSVRVLLDGGTGVEAPDSGAAPR